jgi:hypothetical protein
MPQVQQFGADHDFERTIRYAKVQLNDRTWVDVEYAVEIDWVRIREMAEKAARNKSKRSKFGPLTVFVARVIRA